MSNDVIIQCWLASGKLTQSASFNLWKEGWNHGKSKNQTQDSEVGKQNHATCINYDTIFVT